MSAIFSHPIAGPSNAPSDHFTPSPLGLLDLFRVTLPRSLCENSPPCLSNEELKNRFLAEHTTYPEALKIETPIPPAQLRIIQNLFIEAQIYLQLYDNAPQVFRPTSENSSSRHCLAFRGTENKIHCFLWTPTPTKSYHPIFDAVTQKQYTLHCTKPHVLNTHYWGAINDHEDRWDDHRLLELTADRDPSAEKPQPVIWIPDQMVHNLQDRLLQPDRHFKLICQAWVSGKNLPIQKSSPTPPWRPHPLLENLMMDVLNNTKESDEESDELELDTIEASFTSAEFQEYLSEHTTYPQTYQRLIANPNPPYIIEEDVLKVIYWIAATSVNIKKGKTQNFSIDREFTGCFLGYINENAKLDVIYWTGSVDPENVHVQSSILGKGKCNLAQRVENMATGEKWVLKHLYGNLTRSYSSRLYSTFRETHLLKLLHATYGSIPGLPSPPILTIPPQTSFYEKTPPLIGAVIENDHGSPLNKITRTQLTPAQTVSLYSNFANIMKLIHFLNNLEFPISHVYHCDIKQDNILAKVEGDDVTLTLIDFGLYRELDDFAGSTWNMYAEGYGCEVDDRLLSMMCTARDMEGVKAIMNARETFALGCTLTAILNIPPRSSTSIRKDYLVNQALNQRLPVDFYWNIYRLTRDMLHFDYQTRISLPDAINTLRQICDRAIQFLKK